MPWAQVLSAEGRTPSQFHLPPQSLSPIRVPPLPLPIRSQILSRCEQREEPEGWDQTLASSRKSSSAPLIPQGSPPCAVCVPDRAPAQGLPDREGCGDPPRQQRWAPSGKSEWAARARPMARGPSAHPSACAPTCCCARAVGGTGSRVSAALRGRGLLSFKSLCEAKFCCGFSLPASPPAPAPLASAGHAGLSRHRRRVPPGAGREGGPAPKAPGLARPHFPGARAAAPAPLRPGGRRTTPPRSRARRVPPAHHVPLPACAVEPLPTQAPAPEQSPKAPSATASALSFFLMPGRILQPFQAQVPFCSLSHPGVPGCG